MSSIVESKNIKELKEEILENKQIKVSMETKETRLELIVQTFVDNIILTALAEIKSTLQITKFNAQVSCLRLSPSKRTHKDFLDDDFINNAPLIIFQDSKQSEPISDCSKTANKTPSQKVVDFANPDQRYLWDKENYDPIKKQYSTDRKKRIKGLSDNKGNNSRIPLADLAQKNLVVIIISKFLGI